MRAATQAFAAEARKGLEAVGLIKASAKDALAHAMDGGMMKANEVRRPAGRACSRRVGMAGARHHHHQTQCGVT